MFGVEASMTFFLKILFFPLLFGTISAAAAYGWQQYSGSTNTITFVIGCGAFCILMALWNYFRLAWQVKYMRRNLDAIFGLEDNLLKRINEIETGQSNLAALDGLHSRLQTLEEAAINKNNLKIGHTDMDELAGYEDEKVVMLQANRAFTERLPQKPGLNQRSKKQMVTKSLSENAISIRLQPVVNLMSKEISAVEAVGYIHTLEGFVPVSDLLDAFSKEQLCQFDYDLIANLAKVSRKMEADGQALPIHFTLNSLGVTKHDTWASITSMLKADTKLSGLLIPQISLSNFTKLDEDKSARFLELKEYGLKPLIAECSGIEPVLDIANQKRITSFKIPAAELLKYTAREGERNADVLLPKLSKLGIEPIATHIEKAHQAANMIDLDISLGQGDFISPAREISLDQDEGKTPVNA